VDGHALPHVNASLNALATVLLVAGFVLIKARREKAHKWTMLGCFGVSVAFLACYLYYHIVVRGGESTKFPTYPGPAIRYVYYVILLSHIVLAAAVPFLAVITIWNGYRAERDSRFRAQHRRWAWRTFPIWLYVSITGVIVYGMIYHLYPPA
jgi:uncharacterized membrane protein YozB (DUF420 family)